MRQGEKRKNVTTESAVSNTPVQHVVSFTFISVYTETWPSKLEIEVLSEGLKTASRKTNDHIFRKHKKK
jgi:hypothetical protein